MIIVLVDDFAKFRLVLLVIVLSLGFEGAKQGWFYLVTSPGWANPNPIAFLGDNNGVAVGMLMLVPIIVVLAQTTTRKWVHPIYWLLLLGVLYRALSTHSRGGFLACLAVGGVYWLHSRHKVRSLLAGAVVVAIILATLPDTFWGRMRTIQTYEEEEDRSALGRFHFWEVAHTMANAHPFFGVGYNAYNPAYDNYDFSHGRYGRSRAVHNAVFGTAAELGYVGLALYLIILFTSMVSCLRLHYYAGANPAFLSIRQSADALISSLVGSLVGGFFLSGQYSEMFWHFIGLSVALSELARQSHPQTISSSPGKPSPKLRHSPSTALP